MLDQISESLDDDISAGIDGVRTVISSPYFLGTDQQRDTETRLSMVSHGIHYIQDLDGNDAVPGLAPLLDNLDRARGDMKNAVESLFQPGWDNSYGPIVTRAWPQPSTWAAIDYTDQKKGDIYGLVNNLHGHCLT